MDEPLGAHSLGEHWDWGVLNGIRRASVTQRDYSPTCGYRLLKNPSLFFILVPQLPIQHCCASAWLYLSHLHVLLQEQLCRTALVLHCCISPLVMSWRHERFQWKRTSRTLRKQPGRLVFLLLLLTLSTAWVPECSIWSVSCLIFICVACRISWCLSSCDVPLILLWALLSNTCYVSSDCDYDCRNAPLEHTRMKLLAPLIVKQREKKVAVFPFCT